MILYENERIAQVYSQGREKESMKPLRLVIRRKREVEREEDKERKEGNLRFGFEKTNAFIVNANHYLTTTTNHFTRRVKGGAVILTVLYCIQIFCFCCIGCFSD